MKKTKKVSGVACMHPGKVYFAYMNGFWCNVCNASFINGEWTSLKKKKKKK